MSSLLPCTYCDGICDEDGGPWGLVTWICKGCNRPSCVFCSEDVFEEYEYDEEGSNELLCNLCRPGISEEKLADIKGCEKRIERSTKEISRAKTRLLNHAKEGELREKRKRTASPAIPKKNRGSLDV